LSSVVKKWINKEGAQGNGAKKKSLEPQWFKGFVVGVFLQNLSRNPAISTVCG
jgi:hypothetical protein